MDTMLIIWLIMGGVMVFALGVVFFIIAGYEIFYAFYRRIAPKNCDVFVINTNRHISHHYLRAKDGIFYIDKKPYITNPQKLYAVDESVHQDIKNKLNLRLRVLQLRINGLARRREKLLKKQASLKGQEGTPVYQQLSQAITDLNQRMAELQARKEPKEYNFQHRRKSCYYFIENDPVPKDFFDWLTEMDSIQLENVIVRAQSKDPKTVTNMESALSWIKKLLIVAIIAAVIAAWFSFQGYNASEQIAKGVGVTLSL